MNFLPFVVTFLLLLVLISSSLFSSIMRTARESRVILVEHQAYLKLLSQQNMDSFKPKKTNSPARSSHASKKGERPEPRSILDGCPQSKLNVFSMIHGNHPQRTHTLAQISIKLIENLYGSCDFYRSSPLKDIAHTIVHQMIDQKIHTLEELKIDNEKLGLIYYKMLKGTNTGYPSLTEYLCLNSKKPSPIYFRYATKPVLRATLGETVATHLFDLEKERWQKNKLYQALLKEEFMPFINTQLPTLTLDIFDFTNTSKEPPEIHREEKEKIRAFHKSLRR